MAARRMALVAAISVVLVAVPAIAFGSTARVASNAQTYLDSTGEDPAAPDITSVALSNDDAANITFQVNVANRPALTADMFYLIFLDTDKNTATGDPQSFGADYVIQLDSQGGVLLFQWNGTDYVGAASQSTLIYSYATTGPTIRINAQDLNGTKGFNFAVIAASGATTDASGNPDFTNLHTDIAPDAGHGTFAYDVRVVVTLSAGAFTVSPSPAKVGKPFSAGLAVTESDTGGGITAGTITCNAKIAGKAVTVKGRRIVEGIAVCVWSIPKTAHGKTIRGTIAVSVQGAQVSRSFATKIS